MLKGALAPFLFINLTNKGYYGKESYKKVDEVLKKYEDLLREKIKEVEVC